MGKSKKDKVKFYVSHMTTSFTLKQLFYRLTGKRGGARFHHGVLNVSESTVRRALDEMVEDGRLDAWYPVGHCYDECMYKNK